MKKTDPARAEAMRLLDEVEAGRRLAPLLESLEGPFDGRDRRFVRQLAAGVLQWRGRLDWILTAFSNRPLDTLSPGVRQILRLGAYQLLWLDRVPPAAAVNTAVDLALQRGHPGSAGFVNAVLRRVSAEGARVAYPNPTDDPEKYLSVYHSHPRWLVGRWLARWGPARTEAMLQANNEPPPLFVRPDPRYGSAHRLVESLPESLGAAVVELRPEACELRRPEGFFDSEAFLEGRCFVQDLNAGLAVELLAPRPGDRVLDACAAPGGKAVQLALAVEPGRVAAGDLSRSRLRRLRENAGRLRLGGIRAFVGDAAAGAHPEGVFDRVLVDAPCSGTGVLRRQPEARWRKSESDLARQSHRQSAILESAFQALRPGGRLVYSTCSLEDEENDAVVDRLLARRADARLEPASGRFPGQAWAARTVQTLPGREPGDGAFAALIRKLGSPGRVP